MSRHFPRRALLWGIIGIIALVVGFFAEGHVQTRMDVIFWACLILVTLEEIKDRLDD